MMVMMRMDHDNYDDDGKDSDDAMVIKYVIQSIKHSTNMAV